MSTYKVDIFAPPLNPLLGEKEGKLAYTFFVFTLPI
jgi:hypothetical protein